MNDKIIKIAAVGFVGLVVVPTVIGAGISLVSLTINGINKLRFNRKIKKGLEDGSIVEIDGKYYTVVEDTEDTTVEEA